MRTTVVLTSLFACLIAAPMGDATAGELARAVPSDAAAAVFIDAPKGHVSMTQPAGGMDMAAFLLQQARQAGLTGDWGAETGIAIDVLASLPLVARYPVVVALLEAEASELPGGGHRLAALRGAIVFRTDGEHGPIGRRIQDLLDLYTDKTHSTIQRRESDGLRFHSLKDDRLPAWAVVEWGAADSYFIIAIGMDTFTRFARAIRDHASSLSESEWFRIAHRRCGGPGAFFEVYVAFDTLREQLGPVMLETPDAVARGLGLGGTQRGLWAVGRRGRAVHAACLLRSARSDSISSDPFDRYVSITLPLEGNAAASAIPAAATSCAILNVSAKDLVLRARDAYLSAKSESARANLRDAWRRHVDDGSRWVEADLLDQLGESVVLHNDPPHPLRIPVLCTIVVPIEGSREKVRSGFDRLLTVVQQYLAPRPGETGGGAVAPLLRRAPDGVWYVQAGLIGPALGVSDRWVVISYSPSAVRHNLSLLSGSPAGRSPTTRQAGP